MTYPLNAYTYNARKPNKTMKTQKELIKRYTKRLQKVIDTHGIESDYTEDAFFLLKGVQNGINEKYLFTWKDQQIKNMKDSYEEYIHASESEFESDVEMNKKYFFEYHCNESDSSSDAHLWYRSHQKVKVLGVVYEGEGGTLEERIEQGHPAVFKVQFEDGYEDDVFEDEILESEKDYCRPDPPPNKGHMKRKKIEEIA